MSGSGRGSSWGGLVASACVSRGVFTTDNDGRFASSFLCTSSRHTQHKPKQANTPRTRAATKTELYKTNQSHNMLGVFSSGAFQTFHLSVHYSRKVACFVEPFLERLG